MNVSTGIAGLDKILDGGMPKGTAVILEGPPGTGKTTMGIQFLYEGIIRDNETGIFITFEEFPDQIYKDMKSFGWDLRDLERKNKLRIIGLSPDILVEQMMMPDGLFEQTVKELDCKRLVIDSISLFRYLDGEEEGKKRQKFFTIRNIIRKFGLTSLLIQEMSYLERGHIPFEHFVVDGVIRLFLREQKQTFRKRTLEVTKMRGTRIMEGEHIFDITDDGIYVLPAAQTVKDQYLSDQEEKVKTGISKLDHVLGGGMTRGAVYVLDTGSKTNFREIIGAIYEERVKAGDGILSLLSGSQTIHELRSLVSFFGTELDQLKEQKKLYFIEHYDRPLPTGWEDAVFRVWNMTNEEYEGFLRNQCFSMLKDSKSKGTNWFASYDLNTVINERGTDYVLTSFAKEAAVLRSIGVTVLVLYNFKEVGEQVASFLERISNGVIQIWVDGSYQYLQVTKSPDGQISQPYLLESIEEKPYIRLV